MHGCSCCCVAAALLPVEACADAPLASARRRCRPVMADGLRPMSDGWIYDHRRRGFGPPMPPPSPPSLWISLPLAWMGARAAPAVMDMGYSRRRAAAAARVTLAVGGPNAPGTHDCRGLEIRRLPLRQHLRLRLRRGGLRTHVASLAKRGLRRTRRWTRVRRLEAFLPSGAASARPAPFRTV